MHLGSLALEAFSVVEPKRLTAGGGGSWGALGLLLTFPWAQCWWKPDLVCRWALPCTPRPSRGSPVGKFGGVGSQEVLRVELVKFIRSMQVQMWLLWRDFIPGKMLPICHVEGRFSTGTWTAFSPVLTLKPNTQFLPVCPQVNTQLDQNSSRAF